MENIWLLKNILQKSNKDCEPIGSDRSKKFVTKIINNRKLRDQNNNLLLIIIYTIINNIYDRLIYHTVINNNYHIYLLFYIFVVI